ncbi:MGH1-like glycoside hydrolase domain-containing protein [Oerskovia turbata]|nr:glycogen debranching N-terminal domain-containing protein [Oerskovia turbata]
MPSTTPRQPLLADLVTVLAAPACVVSDRSGDIGDSAIHGYYLDDRRMVSALWVGVGDGEAQPVSATLSDPSTAEFVALLPDVGTAHGTATAGLDLDASVRLRRRRKVDRRRLVETIELLSADARGLRTTVQIRLASDGVSVSSARAGSVARPSTPTLLDGGATWPATHGSPAVEFHPRPDTLQVDDDSHEVVATWDVVLDGAPWSARATVTPSTPAPTPAPPLTDSLAVSTPDGLLDRLVARSLADADALVRTDQHDPTDRYLCAGSPWYLTLFGRDSLLSARMLLPVDVDLALGTLRSLARRQGQVVDPTTGEQPGKILHELRDPEVAEFLPPVYYGTVDATCLWIILLWEAWRWGADAREIEALLPHLDAALAWLGEHATPDEDGFVRYVPDAQGLTNQGWKDSGDAVHDADGVLIDGPVALAEVQAYAYQAAQAAADLADAFGRDHGQHWRDWADRLATRFREHFWEHGHGPSYPVLALGPDARRANAVGSNMGHLLGTGIVDAAEARLVAERLGAPDLDSGFGLRTMSSASPRYNPISYHNGSVWPHDTAITVAGLVAEGLPDVAGRLARGLVAAAPAFDFRLPELWGGESGAHGPGGSTARPLAYPTACSPQAWAATTAVSLVTSALGLRVDVPAGVVELTPARPALLGALSVRGLRIGGGTLDVDVDASGDLTVVAAPPGITVVVLDPAGDLAA